MKQLRTSEFVAAGHPDFVADIISDTVLDLLRAVNPTVRAGIETLVCTNEVIIRGEVGGLEITSVLESHIEKSVRNVVKEIGYIDVEGFSWDTFAMNQKIVGQSSDIAQGVILDTERKHIGAGDQGMMIGFSTLETVKGLPVQFHIAKELMALHNSLGNDRAVMGIYPDAKCQMTIGQGENTLVFSVSHLAKTEFPEIEHYVQSLIRVLLRAYPEYEPFLNEKTTYLINPTGRFVVCGPGGDTGLTGRKIIVDSYGAAAPVGGGAFSGKDATKVDRSAAYMARYLANQLIKEFATLPEHETQVHLAYAIGVERPVSVSIHTNFLDKDTEWSIAHAYMERYYDNLSVKGIIDFLQLDECKFAVTAKNGHFGLPTFFPEDDRYFTWEH